MLQIFLLINPVPFKGHIYRFFNYKNTENRNNTYMKTSMYYITEISKRTINQNKRKFL